MADNLEWIGKRVRGKSGTGYTGIFIVKGVTTSGKAYCERTHGFGGHIRAIQIAYLEVVEGEPAPNQEAPNG